MICLSEKNLKINSEMFAFNHFIGMIIKAQCVEEIVSMKKQSQEQLFVAEKKIFSLKSISMNCNSRFKKRTISNHL